MKRLLQENDDNADLFNIQENDAFREANDWPTGNSIPKDTVPLLTHLLIDFIAEVIQEYIDAGSERDVTFENEELYLAIHREFAGWVNQEGAT